VDVVGGAIGRRDMTDQGPPGFADFVRDRYAPLARSAFLLTGDRGHAEDLVQSALITTLKAWERLAAVEAAESYARTTMLHLAQRAARRRWRNEIPTDRDELLHDASADPAQPDGRDEVVDVRALLACLPWEQRAVLVLRYFDDLSERETATLLGCSEGTVKSRASRALAKLRASGLIQAEMQDG
jgi:RNA polymerase sigma-70 factor (sigma-E family)